MAARNVSCPECGEKLSKYNSLQDHATTFHLGGPKFECGICQEQFLSAATTRFHHRLSHVNSPLFCTNLSSEKDAEILQEILKRAKEVEEKAKREKEIEIGC
jgi:hypothetical protein